MPDRDPLEAVLTLASQIGGAYRGDWSDFDGRTLRDQLDDLGSVARGDRSVDQYRAMHELCRVGRHHWSDYCDDGCRRDVAT